MSIRRKTKVSSISLSDADWNFLKSLSMHLLSEAESEDPAMESKPSASKAVRWLIRKELGQRERDGVVCFKAGGGSCRIYDVESGSTVIQWGNRSRAHGGAPHGAATRPRDLGQ